MKHILAVFALFLAVGLASAGFAHGGWSAPSYRRVYVAPAYSHGRGWPSYRSGWAGYGSGWPSYGSYGGYGDYSGGHGGGWGNDWSGVWW